MHEASILAVALSSMESDSIDGVLICNSIPRKQQEWFVTQVTNKRRMLPILCVKNHLFEQCAKGCTGVDGEPDALLAALGRAIGGSTAFFNRYADRSKAHAISAGTHLAGRIHPEVMKEVGIDFEWCEAAKAD
ncbi:MAG TPA: hypothetical protein VGN44_13185 [Candidatus Angelobacter sp.]